MITIIPRQRGNKGLGWLYLSFAVICDVIAIFAQMDTGNRLAMILGSSAVWGGFSWYCFTKPKRESDLTEHATVKNLHTGKKYLIFTRKIRTQEGLMKIYIYVWLDRGQETRKHSTVMTLSMQGNKVEAQGIGHAMASIYLTQSYTPEQLYEKIKKIVIENKTEDFVEDIINDF